MPRCRDTAVVIDAHVNNLHTDLTERATKYALRVQEQNRDPTSPVSKAIRFASRTAKRLPLEDTRSEILEFQLRKQQEGAHALLASSRAGVRAVDRKRPASGERSSLSETLSTSSEAPGWMKPQEGASSPLNTKRFLQSGLLVPSGGHVPAWLPAPRSPDDPRVVASRAAPKTKVMGMMDSEEGWFEFSPAPAKFRISHTGMWPVTRDAATGVREDQWLSLRTAFFDTAPDGRISAVQALNIVQRLFSTIPPPQLTDLQTRLKVRAQESGLVSYEAFAKVFADVMLACKLMHDGRVAAENKFARDRGCSKRFQLSQRRLEAVSTARTLLKQERPRPVSCDPFGAGDSFRRQPASIQTGTDASSHSFSAKSPDMIIVCSPGYSASPNISPTGEQGGSRAALDEYSDNGRRDLWDGPGGGRSGSAASDLYGQRFAEGSMASHTPHNTSANSTSLGRLLQSPPEQIHYLRQELLKGQCQVLAKKAVRARRLLELNSGKVIMC